MKDMNILIADDNKNFVEAFKFILSNIEEKAINKVFSAFSGKECIDIVKNEKIDLVFIDVDMPEMDGAQTTKKIIEFNHFIKVIAISFHNETEYVHKMINAGAVNYIKKENLNVNTIVKELKGH
jgi:DNA-binding NarL/FixJ family response regulator